MGQQSRVLTKWDPENWAIFGGGGGALEETMNNLCVPRPLLGGLGDKATITSVAYRDLEITSGAIQ